MSVLFDQLRISDDGKRLYINLHVNNASYFEHIYLDSITITTADKVSETNPECPTDDYIYKKVYDEAVKEDALVLENCDLMRNWEEENSKMFFKGTDLSNSLLFVYVKVKGIPDECTPCRLDEEITLGVTFDENLLYQKVMQLTKELADECRVSKDFIDLILLWNGFKAAIETEHYIPAIDFWKKLFFGHHGMSGIANRKPCGCHG